MKTVIDFLKPKLQEEILVSGEIFIKIVKFISLHPYHETEETRGKLIFPYTDYLFLGPLSLTYNFRDPNIVNCNWKPTIEVHRLDINYGNEKIPDLDLNDSLSDICFFWIYDGKVFTDIDSSIDCKDTICVYNELLEIINK